MNSKFTFISAAIMGLGFLQSEAQAGNQFGIGPSLYKGTQFDDGTAYGVNAEIGHLWDSQPVHFVLAAKATYVDGLSSGAADLDIFEGALAGRILFPVVTNFLKLYVEGSIGAANLSVSGDAKVTGKFNGKNYTVNNDFDENSWEFAYGLGAGVQLDVTSWFGIRLGYEFHSFGDVDAFGLKLDPGSINGVTGSLVFKF